MKADSWIAVRLPNWVGDGALAAPALRALAAANPEARLLLIGTPRSAPLYGRWPAHAVRAIAPRGVGDAARLVRLLRALRVDAALHLAPSFRAALPAAIARVPERIGFPTDGRRVLLTKAPKSMPRTVALARQYLSLAALLGADAGAPLDPSLPIGDDERERARLWLRSLGLRGEEAIALCPGATYGETKRWPEAHWITLGRSLARRGWTLLILGGEEEAASARRVSEEIGRAARAIAGSLDLRESLALLSQLAGAVSNDSGAMHLAAASGCAIVGIFGSTNPAWTAPLGPRARALWLGISCSPCYSRTCPTAIECLRDLAPEQVEVALESLLVAPGVGV